MALTASMTPKPHFNRQVMLSLVALGVVFGDIGTSPLYALRECFSEHVGIELTPDNIIGTVSLLLWAMMIVVTFKYVSVVMRANNHGEGGIFSLVSLAMQKKKPAATASILTLGVIGAALFYGDAIITPAISVLSAVEGLGVLAPGYDVLVWPVAIVILLGFFMFQSHGTHKVGKLFGPVTFTWFATLAVLGIQGIMMAPEILHAFNPLTGLAVLVEHKLFGFVLLGAVLLAVTGVEALYADMGHFNRSIIGRCWVYFVFPCLALNYLGQGALLLTKPGAITNPFYLLAPEWFQLPLLILATLATVIASQAVISGAFSMTNQAVLMGYLPRIRILHTSADEKGQIYVPAANLVMMIAVVWLIIEFKTSSALAAAYGVAVVGTMMVTTILAFMVARDKWRWPWYVCVPVFGLIGVVEASFAIGNLPKLHDGGWLPLAVAAILCFVMFTWRRGRAQIQEQVAKYAMEVPAFMKWLKREEPTFVPGSCIYLSRFADRVPHTFVHNLRHNHVVHKTTVILSVVIKDVPRVPHAQRLRFEKLHPYIYRVCVDYGFMESPNIPPLLKRVKEKIKALDLDEASFVVSNDTLLPSPRSTSLLLWRSQLFMLLYNASIPMSNFFRIPVERVIKIGQQIEI